ncbi:MAG TPA: cytochrome c biogenesis protein CcdA [Candidatus Nanopelagicales bacterium]|jgi:cytochrome c-type biogenesis protein
MSAVETVVTGSLLLAIPVSFAAGVVSFLSPCVLPLVPGYLSYVTGLTGADLAGEAQAAAQAQPTEAPRADAPRADDSAVDEPPGDRAGSATSGTATLVREPALTPVHRSGRVLAGSLLFVLGFSVVFVSYGSLIGWLGTFFLEYGNVISRVLGVLVIVLGLSFLGLVPALQRDWRVHRTPGIGVWSAPLLGLLFGIGWSPCLGPTIGAVETLAFNEASAARGALLSFAYCLGLGLPFVLVGLAFRRGLGAMSWVKHHYAFVMRLGGGMLVLIGVLLVSGVWQHVTIALTSWAANTTTVL